MIRFAGIVVSAFQLGTHHAVLPYERAERACPDQLPGDCGGEHQSCELRARAGWATLE